MTALIELHNFVTVKPVLVNIDRIVMVKVEVDWHEVEERNFEHAVVRLSDGYGWLGVRETYAEVRNLLELAAER